MGTGGPLPGAKARPGRDAHHSPPSSAEVKNEWELYFLSPQAPLWCVVGQLYLFYIVDKVETRALVRALVCVCVYVCMFAYSSRTDKPICTKFDILEIRKRF